MQVCLQKENRVLHLEHRGNAASLLEKLGVNPEVVLIVKDGTLITPDDMVDDAHKIELLSVISGG